MFHQPHDVAEALRIRAEMGGEVLPIAGGTDIVVAMNRSSRHPSNFLDLSRVEGFRTMRREPNGLYMAGGATFSQMGRLPVRCLADAAMTVGGPAIRNRGTIAGNLGTASPAGDGCVALMALDATVELSNANRGSRMVSIADYFKGFRKTAIEPDELITAVIVPTDWRTAWYKIGKRGSINISIVCCAVGLSPRGDVRISFGCVAPTIVRSRGAESIIVQGGFSDEAIAEAGQAAMLEVSPIDDHRASAAYRRAMCGVLTRRLLTQLRDEQSAEETAA